MKGSAMTERLKLLVTLAALCAFAGAAEANGLFSALTNYPNPFDSRSESTTIAYSLDGERDVRVAIYDLFGRLVREYPERREPAGVQTVVWDGTDSDGGKVSKGGYLCVIETEGEDGTVAATRKIGVVH